MQPRRSKDGCVCGGGEGLRGAYPSVHPTSSEVLLAGRKQGREAPEGRIPAGEAPTACNASRTQVRTGRAPRNVSQRVKHPQRDTASRAQAGTGRPPRDVSQRV